MAKSYRKSAEMKFRIIFYIFSFVFINISGSESNLEDLADKLIVTQELYRIPKLVMEAASKVDIANQDQGAIQYIIKAGIHNCLIDWAVIDGNQDILTGFSKSEELTDEVNRIFAERVLPILVAVKQLPPDKRYSIISHLK